MWARSVGGPSSPQAPRAPRSIDVNMPLSDESGMSGWLEVERVVETRYPNFDVMAEADAWDEHTRSIVERRLDSPKKPEFLTCSEAQALRSIVGHLLYDDREDVLGYVLSHIDNRLKDPIGEAQRKENVPPEADLIRRGLVALDAVARQRHGHPFVDSSVENQFAILAALQTGTLEHVPEFDGIPQKDLFKKVLGLRWRRLPHTRRSGRRIGYAGPAYPRGYYRIERGITDPWEPKTDGATQIMDPSSQVG